MVFDNFIRIEIKKQLTLSISRKEKEVRIMLLPLESLGKIEKASLALEFRDLIGIAGYSISPATAFKVARRLKWHHDKAKSCQYLAMILRDYGSKSFKKLVAKKNPEDYKDLCLCECHLRQWKFGWFLDNGNDDCDWNCNCNCCNHNECFHAAHTFNYDCEFCDYDDSEDESECDECDGWPCETCGHYARRDCQDDCTGCQYNESGCTYYSECNDCSCSSCDRNKANDGKYEGEYESDKYEVRARKDESPEIEVRREKSPEVSVRRDDPPEIEVRKDEPYVSKKEEQVPSRPPTSQERLAEISGKIISLTGRNLKINEVDNIQGDRKQAMAYFDPKEPHIDITSGLVRELNDDELAYVISHEVSHLKHNDGERIKDAAKKYVDAAANAVENYDEKLKKSGRGIIIRTLAGITVGAAGVAGAYIGVRAYSRKHESEADEEALELMNQAGYNPQSAPEAIRKINSGYRMERTFWESITSTHPEPKSRMETLEQKAKKSKDIK